MSNWVELRYSRNQVKKAGKLLRDLADNELFEVDAQEVTEAQEILNNWRSAHSYALNAAQMGLRSRISTALQIDSPDVTQRLKERPSIIAKLRRGKPKMQLSTMQDIAGCRGVVESTADVRAVQQQFRDTAGDKIVGVDDYISEPASTGYRGVHLIIEYVDRPTGDTRLVEVQLRSAIQHAWAWNVELAGRRHGYALKQDEGPDEVLGFYRLLSVALMYVEDGEQVPAALRVEVDRAAERMSQVVGGR